MLRPAHFFQSNPKLFMTHAVEDFTIVYKIQINHRPKFFGAVQYPMSSKLDLKCLFLSRIQHEHLAFLASYKVEAIVSSSEHHFTRVRNWSNGPTVAVPLASPFLKIGMFIEGFQSVHHCFCFHLCQHSHVRILTNSVAWNDTIGISSTPGGLFLSNIFRAVFTSFSRIIASSS